MAPPVPPPATALPPRSFLLIFGAIWFLALCLVFIKALCIRRTAPAGRTDLDEQAPLRPTSVIPTLTTHRVAPRSFRTSLLPPPPPIYDEKLVQLAFTHRSCRTQVPAKRFEDSPGESSLDNEPLEHLGDAVLNFCATELLRQMYPQLRPWGATVLRSRLVCNNTLGRLARHYGFHEHLRMGPGATKELYAKGDRIADVFEAYIGALYTEQGLEVVKKWLFALFQPLAYTAYNDLRSEEYRRKQTTIAPHTTSYGSTASTRRNITTRALSTPDTTHISIPTPPTSPNIKPRRSMTTASATHSFPSSPDIPPNSHMLPSPPTSPMHTPSHKGRKAHYKPSTGTIEPYPWLQQESKLGRFKLDLQPPMIVSHDHGIVRWGAILVLNNSIVGRGEAGTKQSAINEASKSALRQFGMEI